MISPSDTPAPRGDGALGRAEAFVVRVGIGNLVERERVDTVGDAVPGIAERDERVCDRLADRLPGGDELGIKPVVAITRSHSAAGQRFHDVEDELPIMGFQHLQKQAHRDGLVLVRHTVPPGAAATARRATL